MYFMAVSPSFRRPDWRFHG